MMRIENVSSIVRHTACCLLVSLVACSTEQPENGSETLAQAPPDVVATNAFYYYHDVDAAWKFYSDTLGMETVVDYGFAKILRLAESSYITVVQANEGMHSADEPKNVTLHLVTDELSRWQEYLSGQGIQMQHENAAPENGVQNSFVIRDAEGYPLRFVRYNPHPGHADFVEAFSQASPVLSTHQEFGAMGVRATAFSVYYNRLENVRSFFESLFAIEPEGSLHGVPLYRLSSSGFVALEEHSGPELVSPGENGMTLSFFTSDVDAWFERASNWSGFELRTEEVLNEGGLVRVFVGYDPEGIFLEWDTFLEVPENEALNGHLP
jgi:catechol 2,3-dioxygenase-like lactoylglutathione lyase family enzyme